MVSDYVTDTVAGWVSRIIAAPDGRQEETLNNGSYRVGQLVGAGAIGYADALERIETGVQGIASHNPQKPWTPSLLTYKISKAIIEGSHHPDSIMSIHLRAPADSAHAYTPVVPQSDDHPPLTDMGNGERFARRYHDRLRYCNEIARTEMGGWMKWNGKNWQSDDLLSVQEMAKETVRAIALEQPPVLGMPKLDKTGQIIDEGKNLTVEWSKKCEDESRLLKMIRLSRSTPPLPIHADAFDQHPFLFNVENGTVELGTGRLRESARTDLLTQCSPITYDESAQCPMWEQFLLDCMGGNTRLVDFLQVWTGYTLTGDTSEQKLLIHYGSGSNGKSTFLDIIDAMMGPYAATAAASSFMQTSGEDSARNDLAALRSARHVSCVETNDRQAVNEAIIKRVTGGDPITARFLHREFFTYQPQLKLSMATNQLPQISGLDYGIWRRILCLGWEVTFGVGQVDIDRNLTSKLRQELPGILNWALDGCERWHEKGLLIPPEIAKTTADYKASQDTLAPFIEECCVVGDQEMVSRTELHEAYRRWDNSPRTMGKVSFNKKIAARQGVTIKKVQGKLIWAGLSLNEDGVVYTRQQGMYPV